MISYESGQRPSLKEIANHPWMQMGFDKIGIDKKIKELFIHRNQTCATMTSSHCSNIGNHLVNTDFDFDTFQEMKKYKLNPEEEKSIGEKVSAGWDKFVDKMKCIGN